MRLFDSIRHARHGFGFMLRHEPNMRIHLIFTVAVLILALLLDVSASEILFLLLALTLVLVGEILNTAIEKTVDLAMPDQHPLAKAAKDCAAAAVLVCALFAVVVGIIVFGDHIIGGIAWRWTSGS